MSFTSLDTLFGRRGGLDAPRAAAAPSSVSVPNPSMFSSVDFSKLSPRTPSIPSVSSVSNSQGLLGGILAFFFYLSLMAFFIFLILVLIHFTVTPIFKFDIGDKGLVNVTPSTDGELVWKNSLADVDEKAVFKTQLNCNYTLSMDILVKNQLSMSSTPRVILYRDTNPVNADRNMKASDLFDLYPKTNLLVYIDADKNDLNVVAITMDNTNTLHPEGIPPIPNIPLESPFRLSIAFQPGFMEVYLNGQLQATRVFTGRPKETSGNFFAPSEFVRETVRIGNLQYWPRVLSSSEIRDAGPVVPQADFFVVKV